MFITTISGFLQQFEMNDVHILQEAGYEVHYASNFCNPVYKLDREGLERQGIKLHQIDIEKSPRYARRNTKALSQLRKLIREEEISVVHCHNPMGGVLGRMAVIGRKRRVVVLYTAHGFHFYRKAPVLNWILFFPVEYLLAGCTDRLITINNEDFNRAAHFHLRKGGQVKKIPGVGVQTEHFAPQTGMRNQSRKKLGIAEGIFYMLAVGELNRNKNHLIILQALALIGDKNIHLGICGRGPLEEELERTAKELGIERQVTLFGFRNDIPRMLAAADCFVFPSKREGLGIAALEAMAAGIPLITSDCRGTREYMQGGKNGLVCAGQNVEEYAAAICKMRDDAEMRMRMSAACMETAKAFDIEVTDKIMREVYGGLPKP